MFTTPIFKIPTPDTDHDPTNIPLHMKVMAEQIENSIGIQAGEAYCSVGVPATIYQNEGPIPWGIAFEDDKKMWNPDKPTLITIPAGLGGLYFINSNLRYSVGSGGGPWEFWNTISAKGKGLATASTMSRGAGALSVNVNVVARLAAGDTVEVSGGAVGVTGAGIFPDYTFFSVARLPSSPTVTPSPAQGWMLTEPNGRW